MIDFQLVGLTLHDIAKIKIKIFEKYSCITYKHKEFWVIWCTINTRLMKNAQEKKLIIDKKKIKRYKNYSNHGLLNITVLMIGCAEISLIISDVLEVFRSRLKKNWTIFLEFFSTNIIFWRLNMAYFSTVKLSSKNECIYCIYVSMRFL